MPRAYQEADGRQEAVAARFSTRREGGDLVYGFKLGRYDHARPLVIDPVVLAYCGYIGDSYRGYGIAVDAAGNTYLTGSTLSAAAAEFAR